jgi:hypothetical protein
MAATRDDHFEFGSVVILDADMAQVTVIWGGFFKPDYWRGRANDESAAHFHCRIVGEAARHGPKLLHMTRQRYEAICRELEDDD